MTVSQRSSTISELVPLLFVQEIERAVEFYRDRLGFEMQQSWEPGGKLGWCRLQRDGSAIMLQQACDEDGPAVGRGRGVALFFNCDDVDALHAELTHRGLPLSSPSVAFYGMKQVFVNDPDGYELCFQSAAERAEP